MGKTVDELPADCMGPECATGPSCATDTDCADSEICLLGCCSTTGSVCASLDFEAQPIPPNFLIIMDQSGSMGWSWSGGGSRWDGMKDALFDATDGVITSLPPADDEPFQTNEGSSFDAVFVTGFDDLQSVSQLDMLNGANALYVFKEATGEGEVIGFRDFTDLGNSKARFSNLVRGRRGTEARTRPPAPSRSRSAARRRRRGRTW